MGYVDCFGAFPWPWRKTGIIEYKGNGVFAVDINSLSKITQKDFSYMNNNPNYWKEGEIGINLNVAELKVYTLGTYNQKIPGIAPGDASIKTKAVIANSTGREDRRVKPRTIGSMAPFSISKSYAIGQLAFDVTILAVEAYITFSSLFDQASIEYQTKQLAQAFNAVMKHFDSIPQRYQNDVNAIGSIVNYVYQGKGVEDNKELEILGQQILQEEGRYDEKKQVYIPFEE